MLVYIHQVPFRTVISDINFRITLEHILEIYGSVEASVRLSSVPFLSRVVTTISGQIKRRADPNYFSPLLVRYSNYYYYYYYYESKDYSDTLH